MQAMTGSGHIVPTQRVTFEEVLSHLGADSIAPSSMGAELERVRLGSPPDHLMAEERKAARTRTREEEESVTWHRLQVHEDRRSPSLDDFGRIELGLFNRARVINCVATLGKYQRITFAPAPDVEAYARAAKAGQGAVVIGSLRAFEEWRTQSEERGFAEVYTWMRRWHPALPMPSHDEESIAQAFRAGKAKVCRRKAATLIADAMLVLTAWVELWNRRAGRVRVD